MELAQEQFVKYFEKYGEVIDSVIMKDQHTTIGFGFITYVDPSVVDTVIAETHNINDKQVSGLASLSMYILILYLSIVK
ncbi:hypothetical protein RDI58_029560 [Solanum bulbocastanum]|uniref:RRM domain-containing protein n=1 Tax=Solanum bulbocastanum TaxID=147425 RepID=A0AAN8SYG5_SOLBU